MAGSLLSAVASQPAGACIQDSDTLEDERITSPKMAAAILDAPPKPDVARLRERIAKLESNRRENDPKWWNDLAGAHLRLGESDKAAALLAPLLTRFPKDYGIHANLGTAYHLLGRYAEAEREIARDLEINPNAHFGLERYHLALLQHLSRDAEYQSRHLYVDEWTRPFFTETGSPTCPGTILPKSATDSFIEDSICNPTEGKTRSQMISEAEKESAAATGETQRDANRRFIIWLEAAGDRPVAYRYRWDLAKDPKFADGVIYMASLNRGQPSAWVMLGIAALTNDDLHLAKAAYHRAVQLNSPQADVLRVHIDDIEQTIRSAGAKPEVLLAQIIGAAVGLFILFPLAIWGVFFYFRRKRRRMREARA